MFRCGACGRQHQSSGEARSCCGLKPKSKPKSKPKAARTAHSSRGAQVPPRTGRSSKSGQVWDAPVDPEGAKRATPKFDKENREPYN